MLAWHSRTAGASGPDSPGPSPGWARLQQLWTPCPCSMRGLRELGRVAPVPFVRLLQLQMLSLRRGHPSCSTAWGRVKLSSVPGPVCWYPDYILKEVGSGHGKHKQPYPQSTPLLKASDSICRESVIPPYTVGPPTRDGIATYAVSSGRGPCLTSSAPDSSLPSPRL